ncbi:polysaccharide lyase family 8 super-sandwich domain-containing protein [Flavobacterium sp. JAS]|uniref:polysaccharide lyase family 8 super-sandwich domain-containing protein n=1 Tax=Flavobacterium sp. JAS TaxID=2897329 RepID=UPI001E52DE12|nr:polysaccharide lyase family 8 super-sandwich domain-containing protein [Flavobacterium sp. JAS]MCD0468795.1 T9SS type A sorting domain-containing protein [Flavobacterium sp. JAS]
MKTKLHLFCMLLLFCSFIPRAFATDYYTASAAATLAGNTGAVNANWTTNPDGITGLTTVTIAATDNLIVLNGGTATITASINITALTINTGGKIIHNNNATASTININGLLTWNGTIKTLQPTSGSNFFNANGDVVGTTAIHDNASTRGVYLGGIGKTINLTQLNTGVINKASQSIGLVLSKSRALSGNCKFYSPVLFVNATQANPVILDLAGFNLQVSSIKQGGVNLYNLLKGATSSTLTISGTTGLLSSDANNTTVINFDPSAAVLNQLNIDNAFLATAAGNVYVNGNLTVNSLQFGTNTGDKTTRILSISANFTLNDNGTMRVQTKGATTPGTDYDQLSVTGNTNIGTSTTLKVDLTNSYGPSANDSFYFETYTGSFTGSFSTIQTPNGYTAAVSYPTGKVQYQVLTSPPPTPQCSLNLTPDLPLVPSNETVETEIETIYQRYSDSYLGTTEPTTTALNSAIASYNALGITVNGYNITSTVNVTSYDQVSFLKTFAQYLKFHPEDTNNIYTKALNTVWLVSDRVCKGTLPIDLNQYSYRNFAQPAILIPSIKDNSYVKSLFENVLYQQNDFDHIWESNYVGGINIDHVGNSGVVTMAYVKWIDSADERFRYMTAFKRMMDNFTTYTPGTYDGMKPDGSGFHHWASYPSYTYDFSYAANIIYDLKGTSFEVSTAGYLRYRDALMSQLMFTNDATTRFLTMTGRKPEEVATTISRYDFRNMAVAGGSILGTGKSDPVMATFYNRVWGPTNNYTSQFDNSTVAPFNEGYFQFNHSMAGIYRKNGWLAICKGFNDNMFGTETYADANRFGRYQSYGAVNIVYPGDALTGNGYDVTTWNWNYTPGTTVIRLPWDKLHAEKTSIDERQQKKFVGSLSFINKNSNYLKAIHGTYGMFAMDFQEAQGRAWGPNTYSAVDNHNPTFIFKKSVFTFDNMLICLGSNIGNNDATNNTLTTLYQRKATTGKEDVNVDSNLLQGSSYDNSYADTNNHWIVDNFSTGFYVLAGSGTIKLTRADQQTPQHNIPIASQNISSNPIGNYAIGYIDHGTAPSNKGYEYVCIPQATSTDMTNLDSQITAGNKPYTVHRKDNSAHIVEYKPTPTSNSIFGYAFFEALSGIDNSGQLTGADYPCLVMSQYDSTQKNLKIAVNNPNLGFAYREYTPSVSKQINITIKGTNWQISQPNANASITGTANGQTTITFTTVDGLPVEISLSRVLTPQTITFDTIPTKTTSDPAFNLTAAASSGLPVSYVSSNTSVATISGNTVTIVGKGTSIIAASQVGDDTYAAATTVEQTLTVELTPQTISFDAIPTKTANNSAFDLTAAASSGLLVSYTSSNTAVATISGNTVTIVGKGTSTIKASQVGNDIYGVAPVVEQILTVNPVSQTISFDAIPTKTASDSAFDLTATASSGLPITYTSSNTAVATISGSTVTIVGKGTSTITAAQEGNNIYDAASAVDQTMTVQYRTSSFGDITLFVGVTNSDNNGRKIDLLAELYLNGSLIGSGTLLAQQVSGNTMNNSTKFLVPLNVSNVVYTPNDLLQLKISVRRAGSGSDFGVKFWYNADSVNSTTKGFSRMSKSTPEGPAGSFFNLRSGFLLDPSAGNAGTNVARTTTATYQEIGTWSTTAVGLNEQKSTINDNASTLNTKTNDLPEFNTEEIRLYPNPATDYLNIITPEQNEKLNILILNLAGEIVREFKNVTSTIYVGTLPTGTYLLQINRVNKTYKFIKK